MGKLGVWYQRGHCSRSAGGSMDRRFTRLDPSRERRLDSTRSARRGGSTTRSAWERRVNSTRSSQIGGLGIQSLSAYSRGLWIGGSLDSITHVRGGSTRLAPSQPCASVADLFYRGHLTRQ